MYFLQMKTINPAYLFGLALFGFFALSFPAEASPGLSRSLRAASARDTVLNVWVIFADRPSAAHGGQEQVSPRAAARRQRTGFRGEDRPVSRHYINEVARRGGTLRHEFPWENAASFSVHSSALNEIAALPFVNFVEPVATYVRKKPDTGDRGMPRSLFSTAAADTGGYDWHMDMVNMRMAHEYLRVRNLGHPGSGVLMAFFDTGFRLDHRSLTRARDSGLVAAVWDFVDNDSLVHDSDAIVGNPAHRHHGSDRHGTQVLALVAGHHPGAYIGAAWGAGFVLARTEDIAIEARVEEDNWAAALVWAERLGVDIVSSSLGYRDGFDDPAENYGPNDMDGVTTRISRAADSAVARGMLIVNSAGNESVGSNPRSTITAPADVNGVVAVGAVDRSRALAPSSSVGPTADDRIKPDVAAPGVRVPVPAPYDPDRIAYTTSSGTSFAAPIVSGILALVLQANPGISAAEARERLYGSTTFGQRQTFVDNRFGHGIPDALRAMMGRDEIFLRITDSTGKPLAGAQVRVGNGTHTLGEKGTLLLTARSGAQAQIGVTVSFRGEELHAFTIDSLPFARDIAVDTRRDGGLRVLPTVVKRNGIVRGRYLFSGLDASSPASAIVHTLDGRKVWEQRLSVRPDGSAEFVWDCRRGAGRVAAGVYFITVRHGHNIVSGRVLLTD
jgi:subtilisin family serine protease